MNNDMLSQEEIDLLLKGTDDDGSYVMKMNALMKWKRMHWVKLEILVWVLLQQLCQHC